LVSYSFGIGQFTNVNYDQIETNFSRNIQLYNQTMLYTISLSTIVDNIDGIKIICQRICNLKIFIRLWLFYIQYLLPYLNKDFQNYKELSRNFNRKMIYYHIYNCYLNLEEYLELLAKNLLVNLAFMTSLYSTQ
jgi:hypothetical protein